MTLTVKKKKKKKKKKKRKENFKRIIFFSFKNITNLKNMHSYSYYNNVYALCVICIYAVLCYIRIFLTYYNKFWAILNYAQTYRFYCSKPWINNCKNLFQGKMICWINLLWSSVHLLFFPKYWSINTYFY